MTQNHSRRMRCLVAAGLLPERAGQPVKVWAHVSLAWLQGKSAGAVACEATVIPVVTGQIDPGCPG